jgi:Flp pilus assembly protein TadB
MKFLKFLLVVFALLLLVWFGFWAIGIVSALLWYAVVIGVIAAVGYGGYRLLFKKDETPKQLEEKLPIGIAEIKDSDRALEEYKRKYLPKE